MKIGVQWCWTPCPLQAYGLFISNNQLLPGVSVKLQDRKLLATLMANKPVSARQLAGIAGWKSHSHMNRLLSGQATALSAEAATKIAKYLGVRTSLLFVPSASSGVGQTVRGRGAA